MDNDEFREVVRNMRVAQNKYYKAPRIPYGRKDRLLTESKALEKQVDHELANTLFP